MLNPTWIRSRLTGSICANRAAGWRQPGSPRRKIHRHELVTKHFLTESHKTSKEVIYPEKLDAPHAGALCNNIATRKISRYAQAMSKAKKLLHTRYRVNDLEKTVKFYKDVLGLEETRRHKSPRGSELAFLKAPQSEELIELCYFPASGPVQVQPDLTHLAFEVDSLEEFGKHLAGLGLKYSDGPHVKPDGGGIAFIDAPEGYEIELIQMAPTGAGY
jgi:lactoylglutathione lyase